MAEILIYDIRRADDPDPFTCVFVWKKYFKLKSGVFRAFGEGMRNMLLDMEKIISQFDNKRIVNFSHAKMEKEFDIYRTWDKILSEEALHDARLMFQIKTTFKNHTDDERDLVILKNYEEHLKESRKIFHDQLVKTEQMKELSCDEERDVLSCDIRKEFDQNPPYETISYLKKAFEAEKAEIKKQIADKEAEIRKYTERFDALREKIDKKIESYKEEHDKLMAAGRELKEESNRYTEAKMRVDCKRADFILRTLKEYGDGIQMRPENAEESDFEGVRITEVIKSRLPLETIVIEDMEKYKGTKNKEALFHQMKLEIEEERKKSVADQDTAKDVRDHEIPGPSHAFAVGDKLLVTTPFRSFKPNQLSLTQGKIIKLLMPANSEGYAFGEKKLKFGRKKKGYFPIKYVIRAD